jgi:hypothetical protein
LSGKPTKAAVSAASKDFRHACPEGILAWVHRYGGSVHSVIAVLYMMQSSMLSIYNKKKKKGSPMIEEI